MEKVSPASSALPRPALARRASVASSGASRLARRLRALLPLLGALGLLCLLLPHVPPHLSPLTHHRHGKHTSKLNVILMISDGYGPASETLGRAALSLLEHAHTTHNILPHTPLDRLLVGSHRSASADSLITDSAAGATAFACGAKSYNGAIGVDAEGRACGTVFEAAKLKGWSTGVVVTSRLTDATPGAFISHVASRAQEPLIALHSLGHDAAAVNVSVDLGPGTAPLTAPLDLAIGGGGCLYLPRAHAQSCRSDDADLVALAQRQGWDVRFGKAFNVSSELAVAAHAEKASQQAMPHLDSLSTTSLNDDLFAHAKTPLLTLLSPSNTPYEIDRLSLPSSLRAAFPPLKSLALSALRLLSESKSNKKGLLLMIEGSQIDLGGHMNDPATHVREIVAYQEAIQAVREWVDAANKRGERSVLISTSDHETGGLTLGRQLSAAYPNYAYHPSVLLRPTASASALSAQLIAFARAVPRPSAADVRAFIARETLGKGAGFVGDAPHGGAATHEEVERVLQSIKETTPDGGEHASASFVPPINTADEARKVIADCISRRAEVGWSTTGHTGVDIPVHAHGHRSDELRGNIENIDIGAFIARTLGLDLKATTEALRKH